MLLKNKYIRQSSSLCITSKKSSLLRSIKYCYTFGNQRSVSLSPLSLISDGCAFKSNENVSSENGNVMNSSFLLCDDNSIENWRDYETIYTSLKGRILESMINHPMNQIKPIYNEDLKISIPGTKWQERVVIYQDLIKMTRKIPDPDFFSGSFDSVLIQSSNSPSINERNCFLRALFIYYDHYPTKQKTLLKYVFNQLYLIKDGSITPYGVVPLLSFLNEIKSRNCEMPIIRNHVNSCLIPFLSSPHLVCFFNELFSLLDYYSSISRNTSISIIEYLIHTFPISNLSKQGLYVKLMNSIVFRLSVSSFHEYCSRIFHFYCRCLESFHVQSIESFFEFINDKRAKGSVNEIITRGLQIIYPHLTILTSNHWDYSIRNKCHDLIIKMPINVDRSPEKGLAFRNRRNSNWDILNGLYIKNCSRS